MTVHVDVGLSSASAATSLLAAPFAGMLFRFLVHPGPGHPADAVFVLIGMGCVVIPLVLAAFALIRALDGGAPPWRIVLAALAWSPMLLGCLAC